MLEERYFKTGAIIIFCDEEFEVLDNYGSSGKVKENSPNGTIISNFYWNYAEQDAN
ncbi:hypothetical protein [Clostridium rectalis]|uniref:hypothetical protein n=1 Tax=Clostridium rectalis TaxID=2040295 RepID=UPI0013DDE686|nr:hypothetical protein [Clostridium rectalis]